ncbi:MAG TPA: amidohydrolase family protein, partial [Caldisericia bacterium]|nr:amidohydrolase family protein [Caldisericia bacterium]
MQFYPTPYFMKLINLLKKGEVGVVSDPHTGPLHARVKEMIEEGALVVLGQDDISDAYYPYGRNNMLEVAFLVSHILWMTTKEDMEKLYDMITIDAGKAIGLKNHRLEEGNDANLVILNEDNVLEALRYHREPKFVISSGKLIDLEKYKI